MTPETESLGEAGDSAVERLFDDPQTLSLNLEAGEERPGHRHPGKQIVLFVHEGEVDLRLDGVVHSLSEGDAVSFSGDQDISPRAVEDTVAVLVFVEK